MTRPAAPAAPAAADALMESAPAVSMPDGQKHSWFARMFTVSGRRRIDRRERGRRRRRQPPAASAAVPRCRRGAADAAATPTSAATDGSSHTPALSVLAKRLGLSAFERDLLLLCIGMELDTRFPALCARAQHDPAKPYPTFALAFAVLDEPSWDALSPERPLRYWRLLEIHQPGAQPLIGAALSADERVVNFVKGMNYLDDRLAPLLTALAPASVCRLRSARLPSASLDGLQHVPAGDALPVVQLLGSDSASKQAIAQTIAAAFGAQAYRLSADCCRSATAEQETLLAAVAAREPAAADRAVPRRRRRRTRRRDGRAGQALPGARRRARPSSTRASRGRVRPRHALSVDVAKPTAVEQRARGSGLLGDAAGEQPQHLAGHFDFNLGRSSSRARRAGGGQRRCERSPRRWRSRCGKARWRARGRRSISSRNGSSRRPRWDDLVLPDSETDLLRQIADQVAQRSTVYDDWGFRERMNRGLGDQRAVRRRERHRQDDGGRGARERAAAGRCTASTCRRWSASTSARRRRTCASCSTRPRTAARSCSSTRPTRCSASAAR